MDSVNSRDIKCAVSRLHHLPGFFVFSMFTFFSCDFYATFFGEHQFGCHFITVQSAVRAPHLLTTKFLES